MAEATQQNKTKSSDEFTKPSETITSSSSTVPPKINMKPPVPKMTMTKTAPPPVPTLSTPLPTPKTSSEPNKTSAASSTKSTQPSSTASTTDAQEETKDTTAKSKEATAGKPGEKVQEEQQMKKEFEQIMFEMRKLSQKDTKFNQDNQLDRLLNHTFVNPYDILEVGPEASEPEIKKKFRMLSILVHPDKCRHNDKAADAFNLLQQAYKTLMDAEKRRMYQRVMREARERVECQRTKENQRRKSMGLETLPEETFNLEVQNMCKQLFEEIEERKNFFERLEAARKRKKRHEAEKQAAADEIAQEDMKAWEENREKRVASWRSFSQKKTLTEKRKKVKYGVHAPPLRAEERPEHLKMQEADSQKPMGLNDDYKKKWR